MVTTDLSKPLLLCPLASDWILPVRGKGKKSEGGKREQSGVYTSKFLLSSHGNFY
jgi:hypothetical protein